MGLGVALDTAAPGARRRRGTAAPGARRPRGPAAAQRPAQRPATATHTPAATPSFTRSVRGVLDAASYVPESKRPTTVKHVLRLLFLAILLAANVPASAQSGSFGTAVLVSGNEIIVAEPNTTFREGSVYVFRKTDGTWRMADRITSPAAARADGFGTALALAGDELIVGQKNGPLHVFSRSGDGWRASGMIDGPGTAGIDPGCSQYGYCETDFGIALAGSGDWFFVGSPGAPPSRNRRGEVEDDGSAPGEVFAYRKGSDGAWQMVARIAPDDGTPGDRFGSALVIADDQVLVSAPNWKDTEAGLDAVGRVYRFRLEDDNWVAKGPLAFESAAAAHFGASMAYRDGALLVGVPGFEDGRGTVLAFRREVTRFEPAGPVPLPSAEPGDALGTGVTIAANGEIWLGAPRLRENETGSVYRIHTPDAPAQEIRLDPTVERDAFGSFVLPVGDEVLVTAPGMHHQSGSVHVFSADGDSQQMLVSPPDALGAIIGEERECTDGRIGPFDCDAVELLSFVPNSILRAGSSARGVRTNDNWGWTDPETGREYALVGRNDGTSFIDITDPANPVLIGDLPKPWGTPPSQLWRDIKTYDQHAFIVADGAGDHGMQVFDLRRLREVDAPPALFEPDAHYTNVASVHNIVINEETGFAYLVGSRGGGESCGGGLHMINITEPLNPQFAGCSTSERGTHDSQCVIYQGPDSRYHGREICLNSNGGYFAITDVTDKDNPRELAVASSPDAGYIHQGWLTPDHRYFFQDDEADVVRGNVPTTRTLVWDLSDVEDPILAKQFMGSMPASAHNLYLKDGFAYQANYRYGMHVLDISDPVNPVEVGYFDTSPYQEGPGFSGAWSTYPFFESGTVIVTSLQEGLFVLRKKRDVF